jgi:streptogramin lyase
MVECQFLVVPLIAVAAGLCACGDEDAHVEIVGDGIESISSIGDPSEPAGQGDGAGDGDTGDGKPAPCSGGGTELERFIWIANSGQGTVSKIDTQTGVELGRYIVRPDSAGNPSRTSVNNRGDVAVANRNGGVTKILANIGDCVESNGVPGIQTSTGPGDILAWGQEECVAWHAPIPHGDNRPVAWTSGYADPDTCDWFDRDVWTAWSDHSPGTAVVALLDGATGEIRREIPLPELPEAWPNWVGLYGGAVDGDDDLWTSQLNGGLLVEVDHSDFGVAYYPVPVEGGYGITVTPDGYVWLCGRSTHRLDPETGVWTSVKHFDESNSIHTGGCMGDGDRLLWRGAYGQIMAVDTETLEVVEQIDVSQPGDDFIWGVAIDFDGFVWAVPRNGTNAYKVSPESDSIVLTVSGLVSAYTYSDMTGFALSGVGGAIP